MSKEGVDKVAFMGSDAIALPLLRFLAEEKRVQLAGVFTQPDRPSGRGRRLRPNPVKEWAMEKGLRILEPEKPGDLEAAWLRQEEISLVLVMAYGHLLPPALIHAVDNRIYNFHASLLPAFRGASPVETALAVGEETTGVSLMRLVSRMDAGPIVDHDQVLVATDETGSSLRQKLAQRCPPLLKRNLEALLKGDAEEKPQDDSAATYCRLLNKEDGRLDFSLSAHLLARRVAAFSIWPGSFFEIEGNRIKVGSVSVLEGSDDYEPGLVLKSGEDVQITTGEGVLVLNELQRPGGRMLDAGEFLRGFPLSPGTQLSIVPSRPLVSNQSAFFLKNEKTD